MTKLSKTQHAAMWAVTQIEAGAEAFASISRATAKALATRGLFQSGTLQLTEAGRGWIDEQIDAAHAEALRENADRYTAHSSTVAQWEQAHRMLARAGMGPWVKGMVARDHAEALAEEDRRWGNHVRLLNNETGAQLDQIAAWVVRHRECCGNNAFATPERRIAHDRASAVRWGSDADQLAAEQQYTDWTERFKAAGESEMDRGERIAADEAEAYMEQSLADQIVRVAQNSAWLDRHDINGHEPEVKAAIEADFAEAIEEEAARVWLFDPANADFLDDDKLWGNLDAPRCQWDMPDDEQPDSDQCRKVATDGIFCGAHADLNHNIAIAADAASGR